MKDPYEILGVSKNATNEQIKNAYRELARKYHPDNYQDNPLSDLAAEKMKEVNEAYEILTNQRNTQSGSYYQNSNYTSSSSFTNVRQLISNGRLADAERELDSSPDFNRNAEWYFLKGIIMCKKGWVDDGYNFVERASRMDPSNMEYRETLNRLASQRNGNFGSYGYGGTMNRGAGGCSCSDICLGMMCVDCCCSSM